MKFKEITPRQLAQDTGKFLSAAQRRPIVVRSGKGKPLVIRAMSEDDLADTLITAHPQFRASIRKARRNRAAGKGISLKQVREELERSAGT
jgi:hypothetical protein